MAAHSFFTPSSIIIVGISSNPKKVGHLVARNILESGYSGKLYGLHPEEREILGIKVYKTFSEIKNPIEMVIFATPAEITLKLLDEVGRHKIKNIVIFAAGFKEQHDASGDLLEKELNKKILKYKFTLLGPNCIGFLNTHHALNATFLKTGVPRGNIGILSQSGALGSALVDRINNHTSIGLSTFISLGNKSQIDETRALQYLTNDPKTAVIGMYLEDVTRGAEFLEALKNATSVKPVIILKGGSTSVGSQAAVSHTGSMVGDDVVFGAAVTQNGAIRVHKYSDFFKMLTLHSFGVTPHSRNVLVLSNAGGMGVILADEIVKSSLHIETISEKTKRAIYNAFSDSKKITVHNPIDLLGDASSFDYQKAIRLTLKERDIGAIIVLLTPQANTEIMDTAKALVEEHSKLKKRERVPVYPVFMGGVSVEEARNYFEKHKMAAFFEFDDIPSLLDKCMDQVEIKSKKSLLINKQNIQNTKINKRKIATIILEAGPVSFLDAVDSLRVIGLCDTPVSPLYRVTSHDELMTVVKKISFPVVAKIDSSLVTHKTEVKGVISGIESYENLVSSYGELAVQSVDHNSCLIQKQLSGYELILGAKRDPTFGVVTMAGLGGIYAEMLHETIQFLHPVSYEFFYHEVKKSKLMKFVEGYRNMHKLDLNQIFSVLSALGKLMVEIEQIKEIDINPIIVSSSGAVVVDARVIIQN